MKNPGKYKGKAHNVVYRSGLELTFMLYLDNHPQVLKWSSEEQFHVVPYRDPISGKMRRYFTDFWLERVDEEGEVKTFVVEVKPFSQTTPPPRGSNGKINKKYLREAMTYGVNKAKWEAAEQFCESRGWTFTIITEKNLR